MTTTYVFISISIVLFVFAFGYFMAKYFSSKNLQNLQIEYDALQNKLDVQNATDRLQTQQLQSQLFQQKEEFTVRYQSMLQDREAIRKEKDLVTNELTRRNTEYDSLWQKLQEREKFYQELQQHFLKEFDNLATTILETKSAKFTKQNQENIQQILNPLQDKIQAFEKKIETSHKESIDRHAALRQQIIGLRDLNQQMSKEAVNLTNALKGNSKIQGNWGELILERILEKSGLEKDREYFVQQHLINAEGRRRFPDVVIHLPDSKKVVIDSKVSLNAYERMVNEENEEAQSEYLSQHILAIQNHVNQLSSKNYQDLYKIESPDLVLMFVPIEPAFALAINKDSTLYTMAFDKNIVIVTPSTLLATLKTIDTIWQTEKQQQNARDIAEQAGALYDKFTGFVNDLLQIGKKMDSARLDYDNAMNKLTTGKGNLVRKTEQLRIMGAKAKKNLPDNMIQQSLDRD